MKNKNLWFRLGLLAFVVPCFSLSFVGALRFHVEKAGLDALSQSEILANMMYIHFADNGNDFGGFIYFSNGSGDSMNEYFEGELKTVVSNDTSDDGQYECRKQVEGFYYNAERGERLWPLDEKTNNNFPQKVIMTGGIFTNCASQGYNDMIKTCRDCSLENNCVYDECLKKESLEHHADGYGYYGSLDQIYSGQKFNLTMGVEYNTSSKFISIKSGSNLSGTFVRLSNRYPVGFVYDYNGGIGLAGCNFKSGFVKDDSMKILVNEMNTLGLPSIFKYSVVDDAIEYVGVAMSGGISCTGISLADTLLSMVIEGVVGMSDVGEEGSTLYGLLGNASDTKMQEFATKSVNNSTMMNYIRKKAELLCRGKWNCDSNDSVICCEANPGVIRKSTSTDRKTYIIKNGDVTVSPENSAGVTDYYDIYILSGNLVIDEGGASKFVFTKDGFISDKTIDDFTGEVFNQINDGGTYQGSDAGVASYIRGNFIVNGNVKGKDGENLNNKYFIYGKFTTMDTFSDLEGTFAWRCNNGMSIHESVSYPCPSIDIGTLTQGNPYKNAALVVIDQNYESSLLK